MKITEHKVRLWNDQRLRALVTVVFDDEFVVRNIKVIEGRDGRIFVAMPSRRLPDNTHVDIAHPIKKEFRLYMERVILAAYEEELRVFEEDPDRYWSTRRRNSEDYEEIDGEGHPGRWPARD